MAVHGSTGQSILIRWLLICDKIPFLFFQLSTQRRRMVGEVGPKWNRSGNPNEKKKTIVSEREMETTIVHCVKCSHFFSRNSFAGDVNVTSLGTLGFASSMLIHTL